MCSEVGLAYDQHVGMEFRNDAWALELNPKGTVPFVKDGPLVLNESNTIVSYIANKYGAGTGERPACLPACLLPACCCLPPPSAHACLNVALRLSNDSPAGWSAHNRAVPG
jgi:hypothetical protein